MKRFFTFRGMVVLLLALLPAAAHAQTVPTPAQVLGYEIGDHFTDVAGVERYMRALAQASDLVSVDTYGTTPEGRPLVQVLIASREHRARMDEILRMNKELTDPATPESRAREIARTNPAILYFTYGIHGNESSSPEAAMWTAWDLASGDEALRGVLDSVIVVMDPSANPDGRDRYVNFYRAAALARPSTNREIRERREPWPGGRFNHYLFDLNRDWAWLTQPETRARLARYQLYSPQVHVDFHEMGYQTDYFFFPAARPINPIYPTHILEWGRRFGEANARAMDREGMLYFTGQNFDLFYPSYGDSWPSLLGAIGMTYEQGGGGFGGRQVERPDGTVLTLRDRAFGHRTTGTATLQAAAWGKTDLLLGYAGFHREIDEGLDDYLLVPGEDPTRVEALVALLRKHEIEVEEATAQVRVNAEPHPGFQARSAFPPGTYRVRARQPRGRLAGALLRPHNPLDAISSYDITAWALPFAYGVEAHSARGGTGTQWRAVTEDVSRLGGPIAARGSYGYLLRPSYSLTGALVHFLENEGWALVMADTFAVGEDHFPRGTIFFPQGRNDDLDERLEAAGLGGLVLPVETGFTTRGIDLGSQDSGHLRLPRLALLGGEGTGATSFGAHWHFLEEVLDIPFDALNVSDVGSLNLSVYDVIVVPSGNPNAQLGDRGMERLEQWVRGGGTLVAVGQAASRLGEPLAEVKLRTELDHGEPDRDEQLREALRTREERQLESWRERVPGTILPVSLDPWHPLSFGVRTGSADDQVFVISTGTAFEPDADFETVGYFPQGVRELSGVVSDANLERLDRSSWLVERRLETGKVILFADDPLFRGFWYAGQQLFTNAILFAPAF
jgi:hypothetical protein